MLYVRERRGATSSEWRRRKAVFEGTKMSKKWNIKELENQGRNIEDSEKNEKRVCKGMTYGFPFWGMRHRLTFDKVIFRLLHLNVHIFIG